MKKIALIFAVAVLGVSTSFAGNGDKVVTVQASETIEPSEDIDKQVSVTGKQTHDLVYFKLLMLNESKDGVYSMVKKFDDGTMVSIGVKNFYANSINVPLMYSFLDEDLSNEDVTYVLYRISDYSEVVQTWSYSVESKVLCKVASVEGLHAMNEEK